MREMSPCIRKQPGWYTSVHLFSWRGLEQNFIISDCHFDMTDFCMITCVFFLSGLQYGLMQIITHEEALTILARCVDPRDPTSMLEAVKLLAAICLVPPDGSVWYLVCYCDAIFCLTPVRERSFFMPGSDCRHDKVLEGITACAEISVQSRFLPIIQGLRTVDPQMLVRIIYHPGSDLKIIAANHYSFGIIVTLFIKIMLLCV